jgi:hypothetical protein
LHCVASPAIAVRPKWALRAWLSFRIIDPFLMRAAYDSVRHHDRFGCMIAHKPENAASNGGI